MNTYLLVAIIIAIAVISVVEIRALYHFLSKNRNEQGSKPFPLLNYFLC